MPKLKREVIRAWLEEHNWSVARLTAECSALGEDTFSEGTVRNAVNGIDPMRPGRIKVICRGAGEVRRRHPVHAARGAQWGGAAVNYGQAMGCSAGRVAVLGLLAVGGLVAGVGRAQGAASGTSCRSIRQAVRPHG